jgi:hypothetical protein
MNRLYQETEHYKVIGIVSAGIINIINNFLILFYNLTPIFNISNGNQRDNIDFLYVIFLSLEYLMNLIKLIYLTRKALSFIHNT